jgi:hypothetical protein
MVPTPIKHIMPNDPWWLAANRCPVTGERDPKDRADPGIACLREFHAVGLAGSARPSGRTNSLPNAASLSGQDGITAFLSQSANESAGECSFSRARTAS